MNSRVIGGILLIVGTSIGGGMLALPVSTASAGMTSAILSLFFCWLVMTAGAFLLLEVNLRLPAGSNMISMAKSTMGLPGQIIAWITYLFLLYTLLAAYISGGSDVMHGLLLKAHINIPESVSSLLYTLLFSLVVYSGIKAVDYVNRGLMFGKLGTYLLLVVLITPHVHTAMWSGGSMPAISGSLMILITSFGFASIVPSLREYFDDDIKSLKKVILIGSLIPLFCYIFWIAIIMGVIDKNGAYGLIALMSSHHATSGLIDALSEAIHSHLITGFFSLFSSICMVTAFLGVSLGLFDFLADGLALKKEGAQGKITLALTFIPPLIIVLINPGIYLKALNYAGIACVILLLLLPTIMAWKGRFKDGQTDSTVIVFGGRYTLVFTGLIGSILLMMALSQAIG